MQSYTNLLFHVVFGTRDRVELLTPAMRPRLVAYIGGTVRQTSGVLLCGNAMPEHVHLFISLKPTVTISAAVRDLKANSSRWLKDTFPELRRGFAWQAGYGAFSVSHSLREAVRKYIDTQERHHERRSFRDEYLGFLDRHGIEYNPRTVFA